MSKQMGVKDIEQRTFRDSQQDGLLELVMGVCMIAISTRLFSRVLVVMLVLPVILFHRLLEMMRKRYTYPRTGYVKLIPDKPKEVIAGIFLVSVAVLGMLAVVFLIFGQAGDFDLWLRWCPFWGGTVLAGMFGSFASKSGAGGITCLPHGHSLRALFCLHLSSTLWRPGLCCTLPLWEGCSFRSAWCSL
jgi:hypothetical protein